MEANRLKLQAALEAFMTAAGYTPHVYFQPPESVKIQYPCFVYSLEDLETTNADDSAYLRRDSYSVTFITKDVNPEIIEAVQHVRGFEYDRQYTSENLHHYTFVFTFGYYWKTPSLDLSQIGAELLGDYYD